MTTRSKEVHCTDFQDAFHKKERLLETFWDLNVYSELIEGTGFLTIIYAPSEIIETVFVYN